MNKFMDKDWIEMNAKGLITKKLQQIDEFEANFRPNTASRAMYKWCTDYNYRKNEWQFRQGVAEYAKYNAHKSFLKL
tara:strand:- start:139 stop:369 length:231 start_codon:yes stop_codon:yes gene_type:complete